VKQFSNILYVYYEIVKTNNFTITAAHTH